MGSFLRFCIFSTLLKYASACENGKLNFLFFNNILLFACFPFVFSSLVFTPTLLRDNGLPSNTICVFRDITRKFGDLKTHIKEMKFQQVSLKT